SAICAIEAFSHRSLTLIVGGADRGLDYRPLREYFERTDQAATVIGIPDSGPRIIDSLRGVPTLRLELADDLTDAVRRARLATPPGGVVLLSPAAPSYGRFSNFEHRSSVFAQSISDTA